MTKVSYFLKAFNLGLTVLKRQNPGQQSKGREADTTGKLYLEPQVEGRKRASTGNGMNFFSLKVDLPVAHLLQ